MSVLDDKCIITAAVTGGDVVPSQAPYLPITPREIADEAVRSVDAGAAVVHVHARDPETGEPSCRLEVYEEILATIKSRCDAIICPTTGGNAAMTLEERLQIIPKFKPEMATLNMGTMNYATHFVVESYERRGRAFKYDWERSFLESTKDCVFKNTFKDLEYFIKIMEENDVRPECEIYDLGMIHNTSYLVQKGLLKRPLQIQFVLGVLGGARADSATLFHLKTVCDEEFGKGQYTWSTVGAGYPQEFHLGALSLLLGGNVRVGMEDNQRTGKNVYAKSNAELVEKAVKIARSLDREIATPAEARLILNLKGKDNVGF
ncbi:MAG: 3-keto-5-aminohexanoate cleavage protein [Thermodesulfobacteriota bacterium]